MGSPTSPVLCRRSDRWLPSRSLGCPSLRGTDSCATYFALVEGGAPSASRALVDRACPTGSFGIGGSSASQVPWQSFVRLLRSPTPPRPPRMALSRFGSAARLPTPAAHRDDEISGLNSAALALPVYASQAGSPHTHARLGSSGRQLCWVGLSPTGLRQMVSLMFYMRFLHLRAYVAHR